MKREYICNTLALIIIFVGGAVVCGWLFDIPILKSILPNWVTMKFTTAICFICSGVILLLLCQYLKGRITVALTFLPTFYFVLALILSAIFLSMVLNVKLGIENLFIKEDMSALLSAYPGRPSIGTILNFTLISIAGLAALLQLSKIRLCIYICGVIVILVGLIALLGYFIEAPYLYYYIEDASTAMAFHTALLFVLAGSSLVCLKDVGEK